MLFDFLERMLITMFLSFFCYIGKTLIRANSELSHLPSIYSEFEKSQSTKSRKRKHDVGSDEEFQDDEGRIGVSGVIEVQN